MRSRNIEPDERSHTGMNPARALAVLLAIAALLPRGGAANELPLAPGEYERKTIIYIPTAFPEKSARLSSQDAGVYIRGIGSVLSNPRFHFYSLEEGVTKQFIRDAAGKSVDGPSLADAINSAVIPELTRILDAQKLVLAQQYQSESDRESFIQTKAKELGIDADLIEKAYDFSFVALPFLTDWKPGSAKEKPYLAGGVFLYKLEWRGTTLAAVFDQRMFAESGRYVGFDEKKPFERPNETFRMNLEVALRERAEFQMSSQILDVSGSVMHLTVGREDGVAVDDLYHAYEFIQKDENSPAAQVRRGFVRISKLEKPKEGQLARSEARSVTAGRLSRGMMLQEIPASASELDLAVLYLPYHISAGTLGQGSQVYMRTTDADKTAYAAMIGYNSSLSRTGESQAYIATRLLFSITDMDASFFDDAYTEDHTLVFGGDIGLEKRSFRGPVGLNLGIRYGLAYFSNTNEDETGAAPYKKSEFTALKRGPIANVGISFWLTPLLQLHVIGEKRWFGDRTDWEVKLNGSEKTVDPDAHPEITFDSYAFSVYLTRRLPRSLL